jgi:hypothetical protein
MSGIRRQLIAALVVVSCWVAPRTAIAVCVSGNSVDRWKCWEQSAVASTSLGSNPTRDYIVQVSINHSTLGLLTQDAFWDADITNPSRFRFRFALPGGTATWGGVTCTAVNPIERPCPPGLSWSPGASSGPITINAPTTNQDLFDRGFLRQYTFYGYSPLYHWDFSRQFYWNGDTAWSAPGFEASGRTALWSQYVTDRASKGFNVTLIAPAAIYQSFPGGSGPFSQLAAGKDDNCSTRIPNDCSIPNRIYWNSFDDLISTAN